MPLFLWEDETMQLAVMPSTLELEEYSELWALLGSDLGLGSCLCSGRLGKREETAFNRTALPIFEGLMTPGK